ncbi:hypothetical protein DZ860_16855 [Vibrio sinensis]|uniref:Uncharacterized protein n=1 Tax=Vibrio sinensis TaxID=2302434 RepID=A0A3A6QNA8_9VIBR|nr:hypothetical protein [Vibrio sinensis]RJX68663.1 hypothetical protein DZ860_16855 [Vibrio sinensis]
MSMISLSNADVHQVLSASHHAIANRELTPLVLAVSALSAKEGVRPEVALIRLIQQGANNEQGERNA